MATLIIRVQNHLKIQKLVSSSLASIQRNLSQATSEIPVKGVQLIKVAISGSMPMAPNPVLSRFPPTEKEIQSYIKRRGAALLALTMWPDAQQAKYNVNN